MMKTTVSSHTRLMASCVSALVVGLYACGAHTDAPAPTGSVKTYADLQATLTKLAAKDPQLSLALSVLGHSLVFGQSYSIAENTAPAAGEDINQVLDRFLKRDNDTNVFVSPPIRNPTDKDDASKYNAESGVVVLPATNVFDALMRRTGIKPGQTDAADIKKREDAAQPGEAPSTGFISYVPSSDVLNKGAKRATFGFYISVTENGKPVQHFALFSYDSMRGKNADGSPGAVTFAATELFLFGPFTNNEGKIEPNPPPLEMGVAIGADGKLLSQLPLSFAKVTNFVSQGHAEDEPVKAGVNKEGTGCFVCHGRDDQFPQSTLPFPWVAVTPTPSPTPTPAPEQPKKNGVSFEPIPGSMIAAITPAAGTTSALASGASAALPPFAGANSEIVLNVESGVNSPQPEQAGAGGLLMLTERDDNTKRFWRVTPDSAGRIVLGASLLEHLKALSLVKNVDESGQPQIVSTCTVGNPSHFPGLDSMRELPANGPRITEIQSSAQPGDLVQVHIAGAHAAETRFLVDGVPVAPLGVSDVGASLRIPPSMALGPAKIQIVSGAQVGNATVVSIARVYADPVPASEPGVDEAVTLHVDGLMPNDHAIIYCAIGGAATMADGTLTASVPVQNGLAHLRIRGIRSGQALLRFHLHVAHAGAREAP